MSKLRRKKDLPSEKDVDERLKAYSCSESGTEYEYKLNLLHALEESSCRTGLKKCNENIDDQLPVACSSKSADLFQSRYSVDSRQALKKSPILKPFVKLYRTDVVKNRLSLKTPNNTKKNLQKFETKRDVSFVRSDIPLQYFTKPPNLTEQEFLQKIHEDLDVIQHCLKAHHNQLRKSEFFEFKSGSLKDVNNLGFACWNEVLLNVRESRKSKENRCHENEDQTGYSRQNIMDVKKKIRDAMKKSQTISNITHDECSSLSKPSKYKYRQVVDSSDNDSALPNERKRAKRAIQFEKKKDHHEAVSFQVACPICQVFYNSGEEILVHASTCEQLDDDIMLLS